MINIPGSSNVFVGWIIIHIADHMYIRCSSDIHFVHAKGIHIYIYILYCLQNTPFHLGKRAGRTTEWVYVRIVPYQVKTKLINFYTDRFASIFHPNMSLGFTSCILNHNHIDLTCISLQSNTNRKKQNFVYFPIYLFIRCFCNVFKQPITNRYVNGYVFMWHVCCISDHITRYRLPYTDGARKAIIPLHIYITYSDQAMYWKISE